jgi:protein-tyrosine phosphatase
MDPCHPEAPGSSHVCPTPPASHAVPDPIRICFVCLGNICRSPTAEGVFVHLVRDAGLHDRLVVDSAGTAAYHAGERPDRRSLAAARARGIELPGRARQFVAADFARFDYVIAMDKKNLAELLGLAPDDDARAKVHLFRHFDPDAPRGAEVPDPYYGGGDGFETVLDICASASHGLLVHLRRAHDLG